MYKHSTSYHPVFEGCFADLFILSRSFDNVQRLQSLFVWQETHQIIKIDEPAIKQNIILD